MEKLTPEEFQKKLWTWLEEKGIFSEMKTQLRRHIIDVLKSSEIGDAVSYEQKLKRSLSPKYKAVNLLIAEYLLKQGYQYALSIFSVEDPTLSILPEHLTKHYIESENGSESFKFVYDDVWDILETLGYSKNSKKIQEMYLKYANDSSNKSLILCLLLCSSEIVNELEEIKNKDTENKICFSSVACQTIEDNVIDNKITICNQREDKCSHEVYQNMQFAFDHELEIMKEEERKKYLNDLKNIQSKLILKLKSERNKSKEREILYKKKIKKEFDDEIRRMREKELLKEVENERNLQKELEIERQKLFEEYKTLAQKKNIKVSTLTELQQASLEAAMKAVQYQSNRLRKKEDILDKALCNLNKKYLRSKIDFTCQFSGVNDDNIENDSQQNNKNKNYQVSPIVQSTNTVACQMDFIEDFGVKMKHSKFAQTNVDNISIDCQTDTILDRKMQVCEKSVQTSNVLTFNNKNENFGTSRKKSNDLLVKNQTIASMQNLMKNLQNENVHLKHENQQQRVQIDELLDKHSSMHKEVTEARLDAQELSNQVMEFEKMIDSNCLSPPCNNLSKRDSFSIEHKIEKLKSKRTDIKFTDEGLQKIKETLKMLEREGEELDKSFREFKLKQLNRPKSTISTKKNYSNNSIDKNEERLNQMISMSPSSSIKKQLRDTRLLKNKDVLLLPSCNNDNIYNYKMYEYSENRGSITERAFKHLMNFDKNILQNYVTISKDVKMYDPKNPKAFADMLKERHLIKKSICDTNDLKMLTSIQMPKMDYCDRNTSKAKYAKFNNNINFVNKKYQMKNPVYNDKQQNSNSFSFVKSQQSSLKQNSNNVEKEYIKNVDSDLSIKLKAVNLGKKNLHENKIIELTESNDKPLHTKTISGSSSKNNTVDEAEKVDKLEIKNSYGSICHNNECELSKKFITSEENKNELENDKKINTLVYNKSSTNFLNKTIDTVKFNDEDKSKNDLITSVNTISQENFELSSFIQENKPDLKTVKNTNENKEKENSIIKENDLSKPTNVNEIELQPNEIKASNNFQILEIPELTQIAESKKSVSCNENITENKDVKDIEISNNIIIENTVNDFFIKVNDETNSLQSIAKHENLEIPDIDNNRNSLKITDVSRKNSLNKESSNVDESQEINLIENNMSYHEGLKMYDVNNVNQDDYDIPVVPKVLEINAINKKSNIINSHEISETQILEISNSNNIESNDIAIKNITFINETDKEVGNFDKDVCETISVLDVTQESKNIVKNLSEIDENYIQKDKSDEIIMSSSLDDDQSRISIPLDSNDNDSFWD